MSEIQVEELVGIQSGDVIRSSVTSEALGDDGGGEEVELSEFDSVARSSRQVLFGRDSGSTFIPFDEEAAENGVFSALEILFTDGLTTSDIEVDIADEQSINFEPGSFVFRIIDTGSELALGQTFAFIPVFTTLTFSDGNSFGLGDFDLQGAISQAQSEGPVNLATIEGVPESPAPTVLDVVDDGLSSPLIGSASDENFLLAGLEEGVRSITSGNGSDKLVVDVNNLNALDGAADGNGHYRIQDFVIDDVSSNPNADVFDIGNFLLGSNLDASTIGNYLHIVSGAYSSNQASVIFVDREGQLTDQDRASLTNNPLEGGNGADLIFEFQGRVANNNLEALTGFADNSIEQFQALIDLGFLDIANANSEALERPEEGQAAIIVEGSESADNLIGTDNNDIFLSGGVIQGAESIRGNGGVDTLVLDADDAVVQDNASNGNAHLRIRDFTIDNVLENDEADVLDISDLLSGFSISVDTLGDHLHIISGTFGDNRSSIFIDRDGTFDDAERAALDANVVAGGQGADLFLEFQGQAGDNNFERITGFADNTQEQLQALIDLGFLDLA